MPDDLFQTPILFIIFNRPETERAAFDEIRKIRPRKLFVVADGPREGKIGEKERCEEARKIIDEVDWDCEVHKNFSDVNLGCGKRVSSGITWFFENVEEGIILEDDCLPDRSFFRFCAELLERYRKEESIMMISGDNFLPSYLLKNDASYYFSNIPHIWGWATWRRAWNLYDFNMHGLEDISKDRPRRKIWGNRQYRRYLTDHFAMVKNGQRDTWDYQWTFAIGKNEGLSVAPKQNLISNIGAGGGTHVGDNIKFDSAANRPIIPIQFPLVHPNKISENIDMDDYEQKMISKYYILKKWTRRFGLFTFFKKLYRLHSSV
jgi:hypothetical protein